MSGQKRKFQEKHITLFGLQEVGEVKKTKKTILILIVLLF